MTKANIAYNDSKMYKKKQVVDRESNPKPMSVRIVYPAPLPLHHNVLDANIGFKEYYYLEEKTQ